MSIIKGTLGFKIEKRILGVILEIKHAYQMNSVKSKFKQTTAEFKN